MDANMDGIFTKKLSRKQMLTLGLGALALIGLGATLFSREMPAQVCTLLLTAGGLGLAAYGGYITATVLHNRGAFLRLESGKVSACYGFGKSLSCALADVNYAAVGPDMLTLEVDGVLHDIPGLANSGDVAGYLKQQIPFLIPKESREALQAQHSRCKRLRKVWLVAAIAAAAGLIANIFVLKSATGGRELFQFTGQDCVMAGLLLAAEAALAACLIFFAGRAGKCIRLMAICHDKLRCLAIATTPLPLGDAIGVFYDGFGTRLTLFADLEDRIYYITESLGADMCLKESGSCEPTADTTDIDYKIDSMRDIGFLFGME